MYTQGSLLDGQLAIGAGCGRGGAGDDQLRGGMTTRGACGAVAGEFVRLYACTVG